MKLIMTNSFFLSMIVALSSCNSPSNQKGIKNLGGAMPIEITQSNEGFYAGDIFPINHNLHFKKLGIIGVERSGDNFTVKSRMTNAPKDAKIRHSLYTASKCPTIEDDLNKDAFIDINEARIALGEIIVPFDGDLSSQMAGNSFNGTSDINGNYVYSNSTSFELLNSDLKAFDSIVPSYMKKLGENEELKLWGKVVLFQGINSGVELPKTIGNSENSLSVNESIPMGCAVLWRVDNFPEELLSL